MATTKKKAVPSAKKAATTKKSPAKVAKKSAAKPAAKKAVAKKQPAGKASAKVVATKKATSKTTATKKAAKPVMKKTEKPISKKSTPHKVELKTSKKLTKKTPAPIKETKAKAPTEKKATTAQKAVPVKNTAPAIEEKKHEQPELINHQELLKKAVKAKKVEEKKKAEKEKPFVMPTTHTDKVRKYNPSFTKSILDQPEEKPAGPTLRYSDAELKEFKDLITRKLESAKKELAYLQGLITRKDQMGGDESDNRYMTMEDGSLSMEREQLSQMASRQITFIDHLEKALVRIENKTYGICRVTGKLIDKARLRAVPHATLSIEAKMGIAR